MRKLLVVFFVIFLVCCSGYPAKHESDSPVDVEPAAMAKGISRSRTKDMTAAETNATISPTSAQEGQETESSDGTSKTSDLLGPLDGPTPRMDIEKYRKKYGRYGTRDKDNCKYREIKESILNVQKLRQLCYEGDINCQDYYLDGVAHWYTYGSCGSPFTLVYTQEVPVAVPDCEQMPNETKKLSVLPVNVKLNTDLFWNRLGYKIRFKRSIIDYNWEHAKRPRKNCIVSNAIGMADPAEELEVIYDPENKLEPYMRLYSEEVAETENAQGEQDKKDIVKELGLKSIRMVDATREKIAEMEGRPYVKAPAPVFDYTKATTKAGK